jgi:hypothetical protein
MSRIAAHRSALVDRGVKSLGLYGSTARDEAGPNSDVDVLVEIDRDRVRKFSLIDLAGLQRYLSEVLDAPAHVTLRSDLSPDLSRRILADEVRVI